MAANHEAETRSPRVLHSRSTRFSDLPKKTHIHERVSQKRTTKNERDYE